MIAAILIILPFVFSLILFGIRNFRFSKILALSVTLVEFLLAVFLLFQFLQTNNEILSFQTGYIGWMGMNLAFSIDGLGLLLILLTTFLIPLIVLSSFDKENKRPSSFYALFLFMEAALTGVFMATDVLLFYIFWELALIPVYFITALWGGKNSRAITLEFFIYTLVGSLLMLVAIIYLYTCTPGNHSFSFQAFYEITLDTKSQLLVFFAFFAAFAIKIPIFPFHTWQPKTYTTAPTQGSMLLAGIMLKMGLYGVLRFLLPLSSGVFNSFSLYVISLSIVGLLYASIIAIRQNELKKLIAYSSLAHVALIAAGMFTKTFNGIEGGMLQMLSHGVNVVGLFFCYEIIVRRTKTDEMNALGGIASKAPVFTGFFMIILLANIALPLTNSFVGEFLLLLGLYAYQPILAFVAGFTIIFGAVYMLWMFQRIMLGETKPATDTFSEITLRESLVLIPIIIIIFWIGIYPSVFLKISEPVVRHLLDISNLSLN